MLPSKVKYKPNRKKPINRTEKVPKSVVGDPQHMTPDEGRYFVIE